MLARRLKSDGRMNNSFERSDVRALADQHLPCIWRVAGQLARRLAPNVQPEDLIAAGYEGLLDAARKFDPSRTTRFDVYAEHRVRGAMLDALRDFDLVGRTTRNWSQRIQLASRRLAQRLGREPEEEEVAYELDLGVEQYRRILTGVARRTLTSLEGGQHDPPAAVLEPEQTAGAREERGLVVAALEHLPARQRLVVTLYYYEELTLKEIGKILGVGESRAGQIHAEALARLRGCLGPAMA
jgi:RNA polymerase sigma factor for flagellar operon FliA